MGVCLVIYYNLLPSQTKSNASLPSIEKNGFSTSVGSTSSHFDMCDVTIQSTNIDVQDWDVSSWDAIPVIL